MRKIVLMMSLIATPALAAGETAEGLWRTEAVKNGAYLDVRIAPCGQALCGTVAAAHNTKKTELVGQTLMTGMVPEGDGRWGSGTIVAPDTQKSYLGSMWLEDGALKVRGCIAVFCRSQVWTRLN